MAVNNNTEKTIRITWKGIALFLLLIGAAYWGWKSLRILGTDPSSMNAALQKEDLHWWGQYQAVSIFGSSTWDEQNVDSTQTLLYAREALFQRCLEQLPSLIEEQMEDKNRASIEALDWYLTHQLKGKDFVYHGFPLNAFSGVLFEFSQELQSRFIFETQEDAAILVDQFPTYVAQFIGYKGWMQKQQAMGIVPSQAEVDQAIGQMKSFMEYDPIEHPLYLSFARALGRMPAIAINEYDATDLLIEFADVIEKQLYPVLRGLTSDLQQIRNEAPIEGGASRLPNGKAYYQYCLEHYVGEEADSGMIRILAQKEVKALGQILDQLPPSQTELGQTQPQLIAETVEEMRQKVVGIISKVPESGPKVIPFAQVWQSISSSALYVAPTPSTPEAVLFSQVQEAEPSSDWQGIALAYAYGIPGQHVAISTLDPSDIRNKFEIPAWLEGWAWYAATLPVNDLRLLTNRPDVYRGYVQSRHKIAALALLDVNLHTRTWDRTKGIEYLAMTIGLSEANARKEVDRSLSNPGKACAPLLGARKIQEIRSEMMEELDNSLSLKEFHDWLLNLGPLPLHLLDQYADQFIQEKLAS